MGTSKGFVLTLIGPGVRTMLASKLKGLPTETISAHWPLK